MDLSQALEREIHLVDRERIRCRYASVQLRITDGVAETPDMPAYLDPDSYVPVPLKPTCQTTWASCPEDMREAVERGEPLADEDG